MSGRVDIFDFDGYRFRFMQDGGVIINQDAEDVDSPEFQKALKDALKLYPYWYNGVWWCQEAKYRELTPEARAQMMDVIATCPDVELAQELLDDFLKTEAERKRQDRLAKPMQKEPRGTEGYVYLAVGDKGYHKIGKSRSPKNRLASLKKGGIVEYVCLIKTDDYSGLEKELHECFEHNRVFGEWFHLDESEIGYIKSLAVQP